MSVSYSVCDKLRLVGQVRSVADDGNCGLNCVAAALRHVGMSMDGKTNAERRRFLYDFINRDMKTLARVVGFGPGNKVLKDEATAESYITSTLLGLYDGGIDYENIDDEDRVFTWIDTEMWMRIVCYYFRVTVVLYDFHGGVFTRSIVCTRNNVCPGVKLTKKVGLVQTVPRSRQRKVVYLVSDDGAFRWVEHILTPQQRYR